MDHSTRNIENDDTPDKVTIKVKVADEEYHDLVIDRSDRSGPNKGKQVFDQLASITGFPSGRIDFVDIKFTRDDSVTIPKSSVWGPDDEPIEENFFEMLNDGDCFAISTSLGIADRNDYYVHISLYSRVLFTDNGCSPDYCHYVNTRAFLNRQIAIVTNDELHVKLKSKLDELRPGENHQAYVQYNLQRIKIYKDFGIYLFMFRHPCRFESDPFLIFLHAFIPHYYVRTHG